MKDGDIKVVGLSSNQTKGKTNWKIIGAIIGIVVLAIGVVAGIILVKQQQNISEKASELMCTNPLAEQCPGVDGVLRNCHPPENSGGPTESICNLAGRIEFCGTRNYCCPSAGGTWTTDMSACAVATATATSTATSTSTSHATATSTATSTTVANSTATSTSTSHATATATSAPLPVTGIEWPTLLGAGFGIIMILVSLVLAL